MGLGVGYGSSNVKDVLGADIRATGVAQAFDFALGGTVGDGLVIGGGLFLGAMPSPDYKIKDDLSGDHTVRGGDVGISVVGVLIDYYFNPREGFHVQGALGIGGLSFAEDDDTFSDTSLTAAGGGMMLGVGYEAWVGTQWSLGAVARVLVVGGTARADDNDSILADEDFDARGFSPAILFVATHH